MKSIKSFADGLGKDYSTAVRWWKTGVRGVRLETIMIGGRRFVPDGAAERFFSAITQASTPEANSIPPRSSDASEAASKRASAALAARGF